MSDIDHAPAAGLLDAHRDSPALMLALLGADAMRRLRAAHTGQGLSPRRFQLLGLLHDRGPLPQTELMTELDVAASVVVGLLNPLEEAGYVRRQRDPDDRRRHVVSLTAKGRSRLRSAARAQESVEEDIFGFLDDEQRNQLHLLLAAIRDGMTGGNSHCATPGALERFPANLDTD